MNIYFKIIILLFSFSNLNLLAQYEDLSFKEFVSLEELNEKISLNSDFNFKLVQQGVMHYTNVYRAKKNKPILVYNEKLENSARLHSSQMKKYSFFDHINRRNKTLKDLDDRADVAGYLNYKELSENLYYGFIDLRDIGTYQDLIVTIVKAFQDSKSHNENLLNKNLQEMGSSIVFKNEKEDVFLYYYLTQSFGTRFSN